MLKTIQRETVGLPVKENSRCSQKSMVHHREKDSEKFREAKAKMQNGILRYTQALEIFQLCTFSLNITRRISNLDQESKCVVLTDMRAGIKGGLKWEFGTNRCKLLYIGWVNSKVLRFRELCSLSCDKP